MAKKILLVKNRNQGLKKGERFLTQAEWKKIKKKRKVVIK